MNRDVFIKVNEIALDEIKKFGGPSLAHYNLSMLKGIEIAKKLNADIEIVKCGIALMDIKLGEAIANKKQAEHVRMSYDFAKKILDENGVSQKEQNVLLNCVEAHHGNVPFKSLEAEICANADCYRFIYPQGVFTFMQTVTRRGLSQNEAIAAVLFKLEEKKNILSLEICKNELLPMYDQIKALLVKSKI